MKNILKYYFLIVGFLTTVFMILFGIFIFKLVGSIGKISPRIVERERTLPDQPYYLELSLAGNLRDEELSDFDRFFQILEGEQDYKLYDLIRTLDIASQDDRIRGMVIKRLGVSGGLNSIVELVESIKRFRDHGKKVYVFLNEADNKNYLLATAADQIFLQREGSLYVPGISATVLYLKDTLAKVGIEAEFLRTGQYKSAPEVFTSNAMSDETRAMTTSFLGDIQGTFITMIVQNRNLSSEEVIRFLDKSLIHAKEALQLRLVDELAYRDDFLETVEKECFPGIDAVDFDDYARLSPKSIKGLRVNRSKKIGLITASGPIQMTAHEYQFEEPVILPHRMIEALKEVEENQGIKALILRVNSPGGSAIASDIIWKAVRDLNTKKPVFVSMGSLAASGGYYISMGAEKIYAGKTSITGSIGVFGGKFIIRNLLDKIGARPELITFSEGATLFSSERNFTPKQRSYLQDYLNETYRSFVTKASLSRNMDYEEVDKVAQGRIWTGKQAQEVRLVDEVGGYYEAIQSAKEKIGLEKDVLPTIVTIRVGADTFIQRLRIFSMTLKEKVFPSLSLESALGKKEAFTHLVRNLLMREKSLYLMPYTIEMNE
ncbi:MAG: signal peptide peptidase SppA [bacterium]